MKCMVQLILVVNVFFRNISDSEFNASLSMFRDFRDNKLNGYIGKIIKHHYYKISPYLINLVQDNFNLRLISGVLIVPAILFSNLVLYFGFVGIFISLICIIVVLMFLRNFKQCDIC